MGDLPLRTPTDRRLGGPLPRRQPNQTHPHPIAVNLCSESDVILGIHRVLIRISTGYALLRGRLDTRYSPVRRSPAKSASWLPDAPRLACVKPVASVHPEPGSNSSLYRISLPTQNYYALCIINYALNHLCLRTTIQYQVKSTISISWRFISSTQHTHWKYVASCTTSVYVNLSKNSFFLPPNFGKRVQRYELFPNRQNF